MVEITGLEDPHDKEKNDLNATSLSKNKEKIILSERCFHDYSLMQFLCKVLLFRKCKAIGGLHCARRKCYKLVELVLSNSHNDFRQNVIRKKKD